MPIAAIGLGLGTAIGGAATAGAMVYDAHKQSGAVKESSRRQTDAATEAARIEDEAAKRAEAFQRQQAQQQWAEAEAVRRANYDQWASRQRSLNAFRAKYGYGAVEIPGYAPSQDPGYVSAGGTGPAEPPATVVPPKVNDPNRPTPMGAVDAYLPSQGAAYQSYEADQGPPVPPMRGGPVPRRRPIMSVGGYLR